MTSKSCIYFLTTPNLRDILAAAGVIANEAEITNVEVLSEHEETVLKFNSLTVTTVVSCAVKVREAHRVRSLDIELRHWPLENYWELLE